VRTNFEVSVTHEKKPLGGVAIDVYTSDQNGDGALRLSGKSKADGTFTVQNLSPGDYWLGVKLLGVRATGSDCFYVANRPSRRAKRTLQYSWGDWPLVVPKLAGKLVELASPVNHDNPVSLPIPRARLTLRNATSGASYTTTSTEGGGFDFDSVPSGIYVLEVDYENEPNHDPRPDYVVIKINPDANGSPISLTRMQSGNGTYLVPSPAGN